MDDGAAIAVLAADVHLHRNSGQILHNIFAHQARMIGGAAGTDHHAPSGGKGFLRDLRKGDTPIPYPRGHRLPDGLGLLHHLLEHEMGIAALFSRQIRPSPHGRAWCSTGMPRLASTTLDPSPWSPPPHRHPPGGSTSRVWASRAGMSLAMKFSPSPRPMTRGLSLRAQTIAIPAPAPTSPPERRSPEACVMARCRRPAPGLPWS